MAYWMLGMGARVFYNLLGRSLEMVPVRLRRRDVSGGVEWLEILWCFLCIVLLLGKSVVEIESSIELRLRIFS